MGEIMRKNKNKALLVASIIAMGFMSPSFAANVNNNFQSSAALSSNCLLTASDINFGQMLLGGQTTYANGSLSILCTKNTSYNIALTFGHPDTTGPYLNGKPNDGVLIGKNSGDKEDYAVTSTLNGSYSWGLQGAVNGVGTGAMQTWTTYGVLTTGYNGTSKYPTPDTYSDSITVTVSY